MRTFLSLGSNMGDRRSTLQWAVESLPDLVGVSPVYESTPVGGPPQEPFLNLVVEMNTDLRPIELLGLCHRLEGAADRVRGERWGPRTLDIDIIWMEGVELDDPDLTIPHLRWKERRFVLAPMPKAVLSAIVIGAVINLLRIRPLLGLWRASRPQFVVSWATFLLTLVLTPRIDYAVVIGIALALAVHLWRESRLGIDYQRDADTLTVVLTGVLWFMSAPQLEDSLKNRLESEPDVTHLRIDGHGLGRVDLSGVMLLARVVEEAVEEGQGVELVGLPTRTVEMLERMGVAGSGKATSEGKDDRGQVTP